MKDQKGDRRSTRTRRLLQHALFELMLEKRYDRITIQDIINRANVGRSTFYDHYEDKEDLAAHAIEGLMEQLSREAMRDASEFPLMPVAKLFQHVQEQQPAFQAMARGHAIELFSERTKRYWNKQIEAQLRAQSPAAEEPAVPLALVSSFVSNTLVMLVQWWLDNKMPYPPEQMNEIFQRLVMPGVQASLRR